MGVICIVALLNSAADYAPCFALCGDQNTKRSKHPTSELKCEFGAVLETSGFRYPDFSLGQAERPAIRRVAKITGGSPNPLLLRKE